MSKIITLVGSRQTPRETLIMMKEFIIFGNKKGYIFRSGGADGADHMVTLYALNAEIYLPWYRFNGVDNGIVVTMTKKHYEMVGKIHPAPERLSQGAYKLHGRNLNQILGRNIEEPLYSDFVVCWTPDAQPVGGTRTAIVMAQMYDIPVINLGNEEGIKKLNELMR